MFDDHANEVVMGIFVFLAGYVGVLAGCVWWLQAKHYNEAIVVIGLMPLGILLVPFVRLILLAVPSIVPIGMVMMPLILIVIVAVLPDRSSLSRSHRRRQSGGIDWTRFTVPSAESEKDSKIES
jgi:hypothetical protein